METAFQGKSDLSKSAHFLNCMKPDGLDVNCQRRRRHRRVPDSEPHHAFIWEINRLRSLVVKGQKTNGYMKVVGRVKSRVRPDDGSKDWKPRDWLDRKHFWRPLLLLIPKSRMYLAEAVRPSLPELTAESSVSVAHMRPPHL